MSTQISSNKKELFKSIIKGTIVSVLSTLIMILIFALIIRFFNIKDSWIFPINQIIKVISLFIGTFIALKGIKSQGFIKGLVVGLFYFLFSYIVFSILQNNFTITISNIYDLLLTALMGAIIGSIVVHIGR